MQKIKREAKSLFAEKQYSRAFELLWKLGVYDFLAYVQKEDKRNKKSNWFVNKAAIDFIWNDFLLRDEVFQQVFSSEGAVNLLHIYYSKLEKCYPDFEVKLASIFPALFVQSIRVNQEFLKPGRLAFLTDIQLSESVDLHKKLWSQLQKKEEKLWRSVQKNLDKCRSYSLEEILSHAIIYLESSRKWMTNNPGNFQHYANVYSAFMEIVLSSGNWENKIEEEETFHRLILSKLNFKNIENSAVGKLLMAIDEWRGYCSTYVDPYCYDLNFEPLFENNSLYLYENPVSNYRYKLGDVRYILNDLKYKMSAERIVKRQVESGQMMIPVGKHDKVQEENLQLAVDQRKAKLLLEDLGVKYLYPRREEKIELEKAIDLLSTFAGNRKLRYERSINRHLQYSKSWPEAFTKVLKEAYENGITNLPLPYVLFSIEEFHSLGRQAFPSMKMSESKSVLNTSAYYFNSNYKLNRFNLRYNVFFKPFISLGDYYFTPVSFFANNEWFYTMAQNALRAKKENEREETRSMEQNLGEELRACNSNWKVLVADKKFENGIQGDVDVMVSDDKDTLFMQLKRPYFRLTPKDSYYEIQHDLKAVSQLNESERFLSLENEFFTLKHKPTKWYVSSSYEEIGKEMEGCRKVSYFDILHALRCNQFKSLKELILFIEKDELIRMARKESVSNTYLSDLFSPLDIPQSESRKLPVDLSTDSIAKEYRSVFNNAIALSEQRQYAEALEALNKCIEICPEDFEVHGAIANIYADCNKQKDMVYHFEKAIELSQNDPFIYRNYILALCELEQTESALLHFEKLLHSYPFMDFRDVYGALYHKLNELNERRNGLLN
jgi:tetratricopeptide (TPR) repeat protein